MFVKIKSKKEKNFDFTTVSICNDQGGTEFLPVGTYTVKVTDRWHDYEIGNRAKGILVSRKDIDVSRKAGHTGFPPKKDYHPERVYYNPEECEEQPKGE